MCLKNYSNKDVNPKVFQKKLDSLPDEFYVYKVMFGNATEFQNAKEPNLIPGYTYKAKYFGDNRTRLDYPVGFHAYFYKPKCSSLIMNIVKFKAKKEWLHTIGWCIDHSPHGEALLCGVFSRIQRV